MDIRRLGHILLSACCSFTFLLGSCSRDDSSIKMKGSDTEVNLAVNLAEQFTPLDPGFSISISGGGSGLGITSLLNGQADIANSSRPLSEDEIEQFKVKDIELRTVIFAEDATALIVHKDMPLEEVDTKTLAQLLSGEIKNWSEVTSIDLPVNIYGRQSSSGTHSFVKKRLNIEFSAAAKEMTGNAQIIEGIKADKTGIGYVGAGYVGSDPIVAHGIKVLKIKGPRDSVFYSPLDPETINNSLYFFQRPLYQFVRASSWEKVKPFIDFEKSEKGRKLIEDHGYYIIEDEKHEI